MTPSAAGSTRVVLRGRGDVAARRLDGRYFVLSAQGRQPHLLNESAAHIWDVIEEWGNLSLDDLVDRVAERVGVDQDAIRADIIDSLAGFEDLVDIDVQQSEDVRACPAVSNSWAARTEGETGCRDAALGARIGPFRALESVVVIEALVERDDPEVGAQLVELFADLRAALNPLVRATTTISIGQPSPITIRLQHRDGRWVLKRNDVQVASTPSTMAMRAAILAEVNAGPIDALRDCVGWHAGAVEFASGIVMFPGHSNAGKSTLVTQLVQQGRSYLTDEAVAIDAATRQVQSFPKAICMETGAKELFGELEPKGQSTWSTWHVDPTTIGPGKLAAPGRLAGVVFPTFVPSAEVSFTRLRRSDAFNRLLENSFDFAAVGSAGAALMLEIADTIPCFSLRHGGQPEHLLVLDARFG